MELDKHRIYATFDGRSKTALPDLALALLSRQQADWPQLADGYTALDMRRERRLTAGELTVVLQHNPRRIVSTGASIDPAAIKARPCFLCAANLPAMQQAIVYRRRFLVLCNPFPIVSRHFTIAHRDHRPQSLYRVLPTVLKLARDFHPDFAVLYNGPQSGASAPDHLHLQALPRSSIPALNEAGRHIARVRAKQGVSLDQQRDGARTAWRMTGENTKEIEVLLRLLLRAMRCISAGHVGEPMLNLFCCYEQGRWQVLIFPRRQHRPSAYYKAGTEQIMVSPGAVDMGGILVMPREEDYNRLDAALLANIFEEISLQEARLDEIVAAL